MRTKQCLTLLLGLFCFSTLSNASEDMAMFHAFKLEMDTGENRANEAISNWDFNGWMGGNNNKLWLKSEGNVVKNGVETSENWVMYSRNIATFWDLQTGIRYDNKPESTGYFVAGLTGLAPYYFETDAHFFASEEGDISVRLREENEFLFTQKLILQPYLELNVFGQDVLNQGVGKGLSDATIGLQLRYEIQRKIAPYIDISYDRLFGKTADIAESNGNNRNDNAVTIGIRLLF
jgi:copper resistance protein B